MTNKIITEFQAKYSELQARIKDAQEAAKRESQAIITSIFKEFFEKHGEHVYAIHWTQYTPYFNDGEECEFGVNEINIAFTEEGYDDREDESRIFGNREDYEEHLRKWTEYEKDPRGTYQRYYDDFINRYGHHHYNKPELFGHWEPTYWSKEELIERLQWIEENEEKLRAAVADFEAIESVLNWIDDDYMKMIYGDHVRVSYFGPDGELEIDEYSHE
ncbi:hypothetical protein PHIN3_390 [Sinorhizobium phage phiN3]|uniref:Uncharacterized protein n=1 Tax=Sinorhizobium phage phiN3 TaxID=1647405 RepID=A0A0F6SJ63_9CAUD|nr:hypothetical protein AVT40_gp143 [Sinorhizobium phage phiN3]AKF13653.1 hypothetical protein PHIN3_390 [Sinorhizobium phage phiN3]